MSGYHILGGLFDEIEASVIAVDKRVGPWLWVISIAGLWLSVWDKIQIHQMYGNHKNMHRILRGKP